MLGIGLYNRQSQKRPDRVTIQVAHPRLARIDTYSATRGRRRVTSPKKQALNWISISHLQHFMARGQAAGLSVDEWLHEAGLTAEQLSDANRTIPVDVLEMLLGALTSRYDIPLIGLHMANDIQPGTLGPLGQIAQVCSDFGAVMNMIERFHGLLSNIGSLQIVRHPGQIELCWECVAGGPEFKRQAREYVLGSVAVIMRFLMPEQRPLMLRVNFVHDRPSDPGHARGYFTFFRVPVHFDQPHNSVVVPSDLLRVRMRHGNAAIRELLEQHAANTLAERQRDINLKDEVRQLIRAMLVDGPPTKDMAALQLGMSGRHLHRQLQQQNSSYRDLLEQVRRELADDSLRVHALSVEATAQRLGFASRQAFLRWFRQATGKTPSQYRENAKSL